MRRNPRRNRQFAAPNREIVRITFRENTPQPAKG
jgi:hypothetical protein